ncbi:hypothetical protein [Streptomyces sp. SID8352]|uniref:hypothetical protein n=1 Tax=Streptomyces sp. SID8352 TaxID=2690338 RepID=UPI00136C1F89|nr:hypothetical protein [Streptomyces sp. SID8352]
MLALRLTRAAHLAVQSRRLLVALASAGTGFLLLCALGYALAHPGTPGAAALRLAWCAVPLAATVHLAVAVSRTDPGTRPRSGLSAIGLGPGRLMAVSAATTALSAALGSLLALLAFLELRGAATGLPLAERHALPVPAITTLLALVPLAASLAVALALRPREGATRPNTNRGFGRFGAYGWGRARETFGSYARYGTRRSPRPGGAALGPDATGGSAGGDTATGSATAAAAVPTAVAAAPPADGKLVMAAATAGAGPAAGGAVPADGGDTVPGAILAAPAGGTRPAATADGTAPPPGPAARRSPTTALPWGITALAAGLAAETYAGAQGRADAPTAGVLLGWSLTALGLALVGPGLTHLCGRLLQAARPGAPRLLAGRVLMEEAGRIGRPLGVVCAVASAAYASVALSGTDGGPAYGPLGLLGASVVAACTTATLLISAVGARQDRAGTRDALLRLGAPPATLRATAALRAGALLALFGPLTLLVAELAALPLTR